MKNRFLILILLLAVFMPWAANAQETLTVYNGTDNNTYVPFYGLYADDGVKCEFVIPADQLEDMTGGTISAMKFFLKSVGTTTITPTFTVFVKEVDFTTFTAFTGTTGATTVFHDAKTFTANTTEVEVDFPFSSGYSYGGGNLLIGIYQDAALGYGNYSATAWYGVTQSSNTAWSGSGNGSGRQFLPKTTFTYTPGSSSATAPGVTTNNTPTNLTNVSVTLGGNITDMGGATGVYAGICYSTTNTPTTSDSHVESRYTSATAYTKDITGLQPNTTYYYRAFAYNSANSLAEPTYGDVYSFTTGGTITLNQPANGEISVSVAGGTATTSNTYALEGQSVTLTATPVEGYNLDCWNITGVTGTANGNTYTFTMPSNNVTATASIVPTSGGSSSEFYYELATSVESGAKYLVVAGNQTTLSNSTTFYAMERNNTTSSSGYLNYGTPTFKDNEKHKITDITPRVEEHSLSDFVWTITASGSDYTFSAESEGSTYYLIETSSSDGNLHGYTTSNTGYDADRAKWTIVTSNNGYFVIHNPYWHTQNSSQYYYLYRGSSGFQNWYTSTAPTSVSSAAYFMYLYKETSTTTYAIVATANPTEGGTVAGSDYYASGTTCTLTATPAFGYDFVSWTEGGTVVSTDASYTFTVSGARTLVANFESQGSCIKPTDLAQVPNTLAAHQAQLSWTENSGATQWEVVFSTDSDFNPDNETPIAVNENPATIPSLEQETTYYARVRAICGQSSQSGWSDKASFTTISGHQAPTSVSHDPATLEAHKVTITWTGVATNVLHQSYDLYYSTIDETPTTQTPQYTGITATSKEIDGLDAAKTYYVWVRDYCGDDGYSDWTGAVPFTTECEAYTITSTYKYRQEFESPVVNSTYSSTTGLELPVCWENPYTTGSSNAGKPHLVKAGATYNYASSGQVLLFYGSGSNYVTLPEFTNDLQDLQVSFKWATESNSSGTLTLGYIKDGDVNYNTFTAIAGADYAACESSYHTLIQANPVELSALPATAKRLAFRWYCSSQYSCDVDDLVVELIPSCKIPTGLTCTDYTATTATFEWTTNGTNQTAWQLYISETNEAPSDDIDQNLVINANTNPFTVSSGLQAEHTYYAWVRGNCTASNEGYSEWSEGIEFMPSAYKDFTYQEGATSSTYTIPFYGNYANNATNKGQMLIPASYFPTQMNDATVRRLTFYTTSSYATADWGDAEFDVLVAEVDETSFATTAFFDWDDMTTVYSGKLSVSDQQMVINLDAPFTYNGGNLLIGFNLTTTGTSKTVYWVATSGSTYLGAYQYGTNSVSRSQYQPKITFNYLPNATPRPINPHATEELSTEATVAWTAPNSTEVVGYQYQYKLATVTEWPTALTSTTALTAPISNLTPETTYDFRVRAVYPGPAYSQYAETQFTTTAACAIPDGLAAANITMIGADLTWNASVEVANYTVEYRTAEQYDLFQGFENDFAGWTVINESTNSSGAAINVPEIRTDAAYHDTYGFRFSSWTSSSSGYDQYLISPELNYTGKIKFYYRNYSSSWDEKFKVGYSSTNTDLSSFTWSDEVTVTNTAYAEDKFFEETLPAGTKYVAIYYSTGSCNAYLYIDDITIGNLNPAGAWTEATHEAPNTGAYTITLPNAGVKYDVRVYAECALNPETESTTTSFSTLANGTKVFTNAGNDGLWNTEANWVPAGAPAITESAILRANATIPNGTVATAKQIMMEGATTPTLTINDGGQLITNTAVTATVQKVINAHGETTADGGWYFIASPINSSYYSATSTGLNLITDNYGSNIPEGQTASYDLYKFDQNSDLEWKNYRNNSFSLANGQGYLYASKAGTTLNFTGSIRPCTSNVSVNLAYTKNAELAGWNLVGNPFTFNAAVSMSYYTLDSDGTAIPKTTTQDNVRPCTGIMVHVEETGQSITFSRPTEGSAPSNGNLNIAVAQANVRNNTVMDKAIISFNEGNELSKFYFGQSKANIYFPQANKEFAIVSSEGQGEMPLNFKANENGSYSLSFNAEEVTFVYLHLIDNKTGNDIDLLETPSYTFNATTTDYESRFKLVFCTGSSTSSETFAFCSNGNWIISNEGQATLQVIDVTGRILSSETVNGSVSKAINAVPGVYMLRLINGDNVKVQKIVVR